MNDITEDELRARLARLDPLADAPVSPDLSPRARELLEQTMLTDTPLAPSTSARRRWPVAAAAAAVLVAGAVGVATLGGSDPAPAKKPTTLALSLPAAAGGPSIGSCIMLSADLLRQMPVAFAGTATSVTDGTVSLDVTRWYAGGTAQVVTLSSGPGNSLEGSTEFEVGKDYLVSATDGTVSSCGFSGPVSPELQKLYTDAYGG